MSSFICERCKANILDSPNGYVTGCLHYPMVMERLGKAIAVAEKNLSDAIDAELLRIAVSESILRESRRSILERDGGRPIPPGTDPLGPGVQ